MIQGETVPYHQLLATALLQPPGDANRWLPVRFAPASSYSLVISSNGSLPISNVRIVRSGNQIVAQCTGSTRLDQDLLCTWKAADLPRGTYLLRARDENGRMVLWGCRGSMNRFHAVISPTLSRSVWRISKASGVE